MQSGTLSLILYFSTSASQGELEVVVVLPGS